MQAISRFQALLQRVLTVTGKSGWALAGFYILLSLAVRWFAFGASVVDWDESGYLLIGKQLVHGGDLYVDAWDTKPPGIFMLTMVFNVLFANPVLPFRIFGAILIALTAWVIHQIARQLRPGDARFALIAGSFYVLLMSFQSLAYSLGKGFGMDVNSEVVFLFFGCLGWWQFFKHPNNVGRLFWAGLLFGIAFMVKYFVLFDLLALGLIGILRFRKLGVAGISWRVGLVALGSVIPFAASAAYFYFGTDHFEAWYDVTFVVGQRYAGVIKLKNIFQYWGDFFFLSTFIALSFIPALFLFFKQRAWKKHPWLAWTLLWMVLIGVGVTWAAKWHYHYWYQLYPAYGLFAAAVYTDALVSKAAIRKRAITILAALLIISWPVITIAKIASKFSKPDYPQLVGEYIASKEIPDLRIHVDNFRHVTHFYTNTFPLSKYYHPSLLYRKSHLETLQLDRNAEIDRILSQQPHFVIYRNSPSSNYLHQQLRLNHEPDTLFGEEVHVWRLKSAAP